MSSHNRVSEFIEDTAKADIVPHTNIHLGGIDARSKTYPVAPMLPKKEAEYKPTVKPEPQALGNIGAGDTISSINGVPNVPRARSVELKFNIEACTFSLICPDTEKDKAHMKAIASLIGVGMSMK